MVWCSDMPYSRRVVEGMIIAPGLTLHTLSLKKKEAKPALWDSHFMKPWTL